METIAEVQNEIAKETKAICVLVGEIKTLSDVFELLFERLAEFAASGDIASVRWTSEASQTEYDMSIATDEKLRDFNEIDKIAEADAEALMLQAKYRLAAAKAYRAQLEIHKNYLVERIGLMKKRLGDSD